MKAAAVDAVRNDFDARKFAPVLFRAEPVERAFEFLAGKIRVDHNTIGAFERRRVVFVGDSTVEREVADDLQPAAIRAKGPQVMREVPDVVQDEDNVSVDPLEQRLRLTRSI